VCDLTVKLPNNVTVTVANSVTYTHAKTSALTSIIPQFGPSTGNTEVHLIGTNFGTTLSVFIDGIECVHINHTSTEAYCRTGIRVSSPTLGNSFSFSSDSNPVLLGKNTFLYVDRWSSQ
jgi:hypothetical protein